MKKIISLFRRYTPTRNEIQSSINSLSKREWRIFVVCLVVAIITGIVLLSKINKTISTIIPAEGGSISEGIVGTPRFINPVLALSDADKDMATLIFSGLMRQDSTGNLIPDLASSYEISDDGLEYTFHLRENAVFHDGASVMADDVVYTIETIKDPTIKSPRKINWDGITVEKVDERTVRFTLKESFASFLENTTIGILPAHLWQKITSEQFPFSDLNIEAVGSGPYKKAKIKKSSGIVTSYGLKSFSKFTLGKPYIKRFTLVFYANEKEMVQALEKNDVDQISAITGDKAREFEGRDENIQTAILPRIFGLYFNQSQAPIFLDKNVVLAFDLAINRDRIIREVLSGYGVPLGSPIPTSIIGKDATQDETTLYDIAKAEALLTKAGYVLGDDGFRHKTEKKKVTDLTFSISTGDAPELTQTATFIKEDLEKIGAKVELKVFELGALNQNVIRPRKYDALFFGQVVAHESDLYAFWHSSQRKDPGSNIALYTNAKVDKLLESALITLNREDRLEKYIQIKTEMSKDKPALFIYAPNFIYLTAPNVYNVDMSHITAAAERFSTIYHWYIQTERIWNVFADK